MASITEHRDKNGKILSYYIRVTLGRDPETGKVIQSPMLTCKYDPALTEKQNRKQAEAAAEEYEKKEREKQIVAQRNHGYNSNSLFLDYARDAIQRKLDNDMLKRSTASRYADMLGDLEDILGGCKLGDITAETVEDAIIKLKKRGKSICRAVAKPEFEQNRTAGVLGKDADKALKNNTRGCSKEAVARAAGLSAATIGQAAAGKRISLESANKIAAAMGYDTEELFAIEQKTEPYSPKTLREYFQFIASTLERAANRKLIPYNPARYADHPRCRQQITNKAISAEDIGIAMNKLRKMEGVMSAIALTLAHTGARRGEVLGLTEDDIDWQNERITFRHNLMYNSTNGVYVDTLKTNESGTPIPVSYKCIEDLKRYEKYKKDHGIVPSGQFASYRFFFLNDKGEPTNPGSITSWLSDLAEKDPSFKGMHPYALRHSFATLLNENGAPLTTVRDMMRHKSILTTLSHYAESTERVNREAAELLNDLYTSSGERYHKLCIDLDKLAGEIELERYSAETNGYCLSFVMEFKSQADKLFSKLPLGDCPPAVDVIKDGLRRLTEITIQNPVPEPFDFQWGDEDYERFDDEIVEDKL